MLDVKITNILPKTQIIRILHDWQAGNKQENKINKIVQQTEDYQQYDAMTK
jgi:hypothetical protein